MLLCGPLYEIIVYEKSLQLNEAIWLSTFPARWYTIQFIKPGTHDATKHAIYLADGDTLQLATSIHASKDYAS